MDTIELERVGLIIKETPIFQVFEIKKGATTLLH